MSKGLLICRKFLIFSAIFFLFSFLFSCEKQNIDFGSSFIDNTITNLVLVDTSTVEVSTVYVDSFVSSNANAILAGKYRDEQFGKISSQSFLQLGLPSSTAYDIPNGSYFDSLEIILRPNKTYYGDTLSPYNIEIHQLDAPITYATNQNAFFNINSRSYNPTPLGSGNFFLKPAVTDTFAIRLSSSLGLDIFNKLQTKDASMLTNEEFIPYFKGLAITGGSNNNMIVGFKDSLKMRVHYHKPGVFEQATYIDFGINQTNYQFNNISIDRAGTILAGLGPTNKQISSSQTNNAGYTQYITGSVTKLRFPYLLNILQLPNFIKIIKAELIVKPVQNSFNGYYTLPPYLVLSVTDKNNLLGGNLSINNAVQYGSLFIDNVYGTQTSYTYDVTSYLQSEIANTLNNQDGLLILPPNPASVFNRILVANGSVSNNKTQVKIYYASVK